MIDEYRLMKKAIIIYGVSGSGKTTLSEELYAFLGGYPTVVIERDYIRKNVCNEFFEGGWKKGFPKHKESVVTCLWYYLLYQGIFNERNIIISDTMTKIQNRRDIFNILNHFGYEIEFIRTTVPLDICIERDLNRGIWSVGEDVIRRQWENLNKNGEHI